MKPNYQITPRHKKNPDGSFTTSYVVTTPNPYANPEPFKTLEEAKEFVRIDKIPYPKTKSITIPATQAQVSEYLEEKKEARKIARSIERIEREELEYYERHKYEREALRKESIRIEERNEKIWLAILMTIAMSAIYIMIYPFFF